MLDKNVPMLLESIISILLMAGSAPQNQRDSLSIQETTLHFRWDKSVYEDTYLENYDAAAKLCKFLESLGEERIDSVTVTSYASPEGVYEHNLKLSRNRAKQFRVAMQDRMVWDGLNIKLSVRSGGEAWELLRKRVVEDSTISRAARSRILKVLDDDSVGQDTKKWRMAHNALGSTPQEGDVYHWLLLHHYRYLRCLDIKVYYHDIPVIPSPDTTAVIPSTDTSAVIPSPDTTDVILSPDTTAVILSPDTTAVILSPEPEARNEESRRGTPIIGLSTNLLYDATYLPHYGFTSIPSFSLEYYPAKGHWTAGADVDFSHWLHPAEHRYNQIHNFTFHARRYFNSGEDGFHGLYLLGNANFGLYGLGWDEHGWEGEGAGISAGIGHKWNWGSFFIDTGAALGFFYSRYDPYVWGNDATGWYYYDYTGDPAKFSPRRKALTYFAPTRVYISIGFDLFKRNK